MKKKLTRAYALFWAVLAGYLFLSFSSNPPNDRTGAPPTFTTCASATGGCHSGGTGMGNVTITGLPASIDPSTLYPITVTVTRTNGVPMMGGFQMVVLDDNDNNIGTLSNPGSSSTTSSSGGRTFFEHNPAKSFGGGNDIIYTVDWTSPSSGSGEITMYAAALLANGNGGTSGDATVTTSSAGSFMGGGGQITVDVTGTDVSCFGGNDGSATAVASGGGGGPYTYSWSNGMMGSTISNLEAGTYTVTATNASGTPGTGMITISQPNSPLSVFINNVVNIDCINVVGSATADANGGTPGYTFQWSDGMMGPTASFVAPGNFSVTATDANGCTETASVVISENTVPPIAEAGPTMVITCTSPTVTLNGSGSSVGASITYAWTTSDGNIVSGANTLTPVADATGTYTLLVTDATNGCTAEDEVEVLEDTDVPIANAGADMELNCNNTSVILDGSSSSSGADIAYLWTTTDGNIVSGETTTMPTVDAAGTYTLTVTDEGNGCTATDQAAVSQTPALSVSIDATDIDCNGNSNGSATANGTGGNGIYSYTWSTGDTTQSISNLDAGTYTVTLTDEDMCTATASATITEPDVLLANVSSTNETSPGAEDGTASSSPTGGTGIYTFLWSNGATTATITNLAPGTYSVTTTDENDCTASGTAMVSPFDCSAFSAQSSQTNVTCHGGSDGSATATPSGGSAPYTYLWSNGDTTQTTSNLSAGTYTVVVSEANGCEAMLTVTISEPTAVNVSTTSVANVSCNGGSDGEITVAASGGTPGYSFAWSNGGMGDTLSNLAAGNYTVVATDQLGCDDSLTVSISQPSALAATVSQSTDALCNGAADGSATITASGGTSGYSFEWPDGNTNPSRNDLAAGNYTVSVTDANDCMATVVVTIGEPPALEISISSTDLTAVGADDGTATAAATGGVSPYSYLWNTGDTTAMITGLAPGTYCVTTTDDNGCTKEGCTSINPFGCGNTTIDITSTNVLCFGGNDGSATVSISGFNPPVSILWSNDSTTAIIDNLIAGTYTVMVSDVNGCSETGQVVISQPTQLSVAATSITNTDCPGNANGAITVAGSGGTPGFTFEWPDGSTNDTIENLPDGIYEVVISDANGCSATGSFEVGVDPDTEFPVVVVQDIIVELDANGMATITAAMIDNGSTDNCGIDTMLLDVSEFTCDDLGENQVFIAVADHANNCSADSAIVTVVDNLAPTIVCPDNITVQSASCAEVVEYGPPTVTDNCANPTFMLVSGSPPGSTFPEGTTELVMEATDASGNSATCTFTITVVGGSIIPSVEFSNPLCNGSADGTVTIDLVGGIPPFSYEWSDGQTTQTAVGLSAGIYSVLVTDAVGCSIVMTIELVDPPALEITVDEVIPVSDIPGEVQITIEGGAGGYLFEWVFDGNFYSDSEDISAENFGDYSLTITDENGCTLDTVIFVGFIDAVTFNPVLDQYITMYPNPASEKLHLDFELPKISEVSTSLLDLNGRPALAEVHDYFSNKTQLMEIDHLPSGIYIVKIVVDNGVLMKRVVIGN